MCSSGSTSSAPRPSYLEQAHGLASLKDMDRCHNRANNFVSRSMTMGYATSYNRTSLRNNNNVSVSSPRSGRFYDARFEDQQHPHFLSACFLCKKPLGDNRDIFMYRSDQPPTTTQKFIKKTFFMFFKETLLVMNYRSDVGLNCLFVAEGTRHFVAKSVGKSRLR